jgi:hypothetical protein
MAEAALITQTGSPTPPNSRPRSRVWRPITPLSPQIYYKSGPPTDVSPTSVSRAAASASRE